MTTPFHARYWAHSLRLARHDGVDAISRSIGNARVDLNPHQVDAALFALRSPYSKGVLLADEVPHDAIADNMTLDGLARQFTFAAPEERSR